MLPFDQINNKCCFSGKFYVDKDTTVDVELMNLEAVVPVVRNPFFEAIGLPYQDKGMMMYLILPKGEGSTMLKQVLSHLNMNSLKKLKAMSTDMESFIAIPKLKINGRYSLTQPLKQIGISAMFNPSTSNFTDISSEVSQSSELEILARYQLLADSSVSVRFHFYFF